MLDIISLLPPKKKTTSGGWISFNAVCCTHNGESFDKRGRGGILLENDHDWRYHCFNCNFTTGFVLGKPVAHKARQLLYWFGVSKKDVDWLSLESIRHRGVKDLLDERNGNDLLDDKDVIIDANKRFKSVELPSSARLIVKSDTHYVEYLKSRAIKFNQYTFMITPTDKARNKNRIIIPYTNKGKIVGYTSRYLDNKTPKYLNEQQPGYVFGIDLQKDDWKFVIVMEGVLDAISIDGVAVLHNRISHIQAQQIKQLHREVIVVPDQDKAGLLLINDALSHEFSVSVPIWDDPYVKDVNDAIVKYGKITTVLKILKHRYSSSLKIKLAKMALVRKLK
jgi:5S rRNA maturation endonuclease (ribonuclease M5)